MIAGWRYLGLFAMPSSAAEVVGHADGDIGDVRRQVWLARGSCFGCAGPAPELHQIVCKAERIAGQQAAARLAACSRMGTWASWRTPPMTHLSGRSSSD